MKYIDGFVLVVPKDKVEDYKKMAQEGKESWMRHGALSYYECMGDDLEPKDEGMGKTLGFKELTKAGESDTVWFSFITYKDKAHRDEVNKKVQDEMAEAYKDATDFQMPFEANRISIGGFTVEVEG